MAERQPPARPGFGQLVVGVLFVLGALLIWAIAAMGAAMGLMEILEV
jgi:hypothetical protein